MDSNLNLFLIGDNIKMAFKVHIKPKRWGQIFLELDNLENLAIRSIIGKETVDYGLFFSINYDIISIVTSFIMITGIEKRDAINYYRMVFCNELLERLEIVVWNVDANFMIPYPKDYVDVHINILCMDVVKRPLLIFKNPQLFEDRKKYTTLSAKFLVKWLELKPSFGDRWWKEYMYALGHKSPTNIPDINIEIIQYLPPITLNPSRSNTGDLNDNEDDDDDGVGPSSFGYSYVDIRLLEE